MTRFADLGIKPPKGEIIDCPVISINDIINTEIEVLGYIANIKTRHGDGRFLIHIRHEGRELKFFTAASNLKDILIQIPPEAFPFTTTIKSSKCGANRFYQFA